MASSFGGFLYCILFPILFGASMKLLYALLTVDLVHQINSQLQWTGRANNKKLFKKCAHYAILAVLPNMDNLFFRLNIESTANMDTKNMLICCTFSSLLHFFSF